MRTIRTFIAIEISANIRQQIFSVVSQYQKLIPNGLVKWVSANNLHITLKFLGDTSLTVIPAIEQKLDSLAASISPFKFNVAAAGMFPSARKPRVVWLGLDNKDTLTQLSVRLDDALAEVKIAREERPFSAHLTIGRVYRGLTDERLNKLGEIILSNQPGMMGEVDVHHISLIQSDLRSERAVYTTLHQAKLSTEV